jgi:putative membrane protein
VLFLFLYQNCIIMKTLINILFTTFFVLLLANFMPGVTVDSFYTALIVALVLGLLNIFVKPLLVLFTLPISIVTLGLFLLVINAIIIMICDALIDGFRIVDFIHALIFSLILSVCQSIVNSLQGK